MSILPQIKNRYSVRSYLDKPIEKEKLDTVLEAARLAPSAKNGQQWRFIVVQDKGMIEKLCIAANKQAFVATASVVIIGCANNIDYVMRCGQTVYPIDLAISMEHIALQAVEEGLGTCWVGSFYEDQVKELLGIPEDGVRVVQMMTLGYPDFKTPEKDRLPIADIVAHEEWGWA